MHFVRLLNRLAYYIFSPLVMKDLLFFFSKKVKKQKKQRKICATNGNEAIADRTYQEWFYQISL